MKNYFTLLALFLLAVSPKPIFAQTPQWHYLGDTILPNADGGAVTLNLNGATPYISYLGYANDSYILILKRFDNATWVSLDTTVLGENLNYQLSISSSGIPLLAFFDEENLRFVFKKLTGNGWVTVSESPQLTEPPDLVSIAFEDEKLYVSFIDSFFDTQITVWQYNALEWSAVGQPIFTSESVYPILKVSNGYPWLAYLESESNIITCIVKKFDGTGWQTIGGQAFTTNLGNFFIQVSIDFTVANSIPYIVYKDWSTQWRLSVLTINNMEWVTVGQPMFTASTYSDMRIAIDANSQTPYVLYDDFLQDTVGGGLSVMLYDGTSWNYVGQRFFANQSWEKNLAIHEGIPFVVYQHDSGLGPSIQVFSPTTLVPEHPKVEIAVDIHPNPIHEDFLKIQIESLHKLEAVAQISDMQGRIFQAYRFQLEPGLMHLQFNLETPPKGVYIAQLKSAEGQVLCTKKFVVAQ
ncbi:MAG: T9SS type A sorting domain-containing protein [Saprospiraceae bacterium]